jgi:hypothetical protein
MTDDLISSLARFADLQIIARDSTFFYKDTPLDARDLADKLNARSLPDLGLRVMSRTAEHRKTMCSFSSLRCSPSRQPCWVPATGSAELHIICNFT